METPKYITQISGEWLRDVARKTNLKSGIGISIVPDNDGVRIEIDQNSLKMMMYAYIKKATTAANSVSLSDISSVNLDPTTSS